MTEPICEVIITADSEDWLVNFTRSLVEDRLVACGQHIAPIRSIYRWDGTIHDDSEMRVALHTRASLVPASHRPHPPGTPLRRAVRSRFRQSRRANPDYAQWVIEETSEPGE